MFSGRIQAMFLSQSKNAVEEALKEWIEWISLTSEGRAFFHSHDLNRGIWVVVQEQTWPSEGRQAGQNCSLLCIIRTFQALVWEGRAGLMSWAHDKGQRVLYLLFMPLAAPPGEWASQAALPCPRGGSGAPSCAQQWSPWWDSRGCTARGACRDSPPHPSAKCRATARAGELHSAQPKRSVTLQTISFAKIIWTYIFEH